VKHRGEESAVVLSRALTQQGKPPALPGDSPRFDLYDGRRESSISAKRRRRFTDERISEPEPYEVGLQVPWGIYIPKRRKKQLFGCYVGTGENPSTSWKGTRSRRGWMDTEWQTLRLSIPPRHVVGYIKGKSAIQRARRCAGRQCHFGDEHVWARGYFVIRLVARVSTII
jgi:hypothetical protein